MEACANALHALDLSTLDGERKAAPPKHLVRRGMRPDGTFPQEGEGDEGAAPDAEGRETEQAIAQLRYLLVPGSEVYGRRLLDSLLAANAQLREERLRARNAALKAGFQGGGLDEIIEALRQRLAEAYACIRDAQEAMVWRMTLKDWEAKHAVPIVAAGEEGK